MVHAGECATVRFVTGPHALVQSVIVFYLGCVLPSIHAKPPPLVQKPRSVKSRPNSLALPADSEPIKPEADRPSSASVSFPPTLQRAATVGEVPSSSKPAKRPALRALWSFAHHPARTIAGTHLHADEDSTAAMRRTSTVTDVLSSLSSASPPKVPTLTLKSMVRKGRAGSTSRSSVSSQSESTVVDRLSPSRYHPDLPMIASATSSAEGRYAQEDCVAPAPASGTSSPSGSPRPSRHALLPSMKMFKSFSRRRSQKTASTSSSPTPATLSLDDVADPAGAPSEPQPVSGEVLTTKFVNPFRVKPRERKSVERPRMSGARRMVEQLSHASDSPRSSVSDSMFSSASSGEGSDDSDGEGREITDRHVVV